MSLTLPPTLAPRIKPGHYKGANDKRGEAMAYQETTRDIKIRVEPSYMSDQSQPSSDRYFWAYRITIENLSDTTVRLLRRYWRLIDADGSVEEVHGVGVVGETPILAPGEEYSYTSGVPLTTPSGMMQGSFEMVTDKGDVFSVQIPSFSLDSPHHVKTVH